MENLNDLFVSYPLILQKYQAGQVLTKEEIISLFSKVKMREVTAFYLDLQARLQTYAKAYYDEGNSNLADWDYDFAYRILETLSETFSTLKLYSTLTENVGAVEPAINSQPEQLSFFTDTPSAEPTPKQIKSNKVKSNKTEANKASKSSLFPKEAHAVKLESLQDLFSQVELFSALDNMRADLVSKGISADEVNNLGFSVEEKIDGLSLAALYEHGKLTRALTRGNGLVGDNVTANALMIRNLPAKIDCPLDLLEIRGEVYMPKAAFQKLNEDLYTDLIDKGVDPELASSKLFANARNACVGSLKQKDAKVTYARNLQIFVFNWQRASEIVTNSHVDTLHKMQNYGLPVIASKQLYKTNADIYAACQAILARRESLSYGIDGAVIKLDNLAYRKLLGSTAKTPRWSYAYKFPPEQVKTKLLDIKVQVGRSGKLTPLAIVEAAEVQGSTIRKASLHNFDYLSKLDLRIGDTVCLHKAGDIIPEITAYVKELRPEDAKVYQAPSLCPVCQSKLFTKGQDVFCPNFNCPQQILLRFAYFTSKEAMNIANLGEKTLAQFIDAGFLHTLPDLYRLHDHYAEIAKLKGFATVNSLNEQGEVELRVPKFDEIWRSIEHSKQNTASQLLTALGLPELGVTMARKLSKHFKNPMAFFNSSEEELLALPDVGPTIAQIWSEIFMSANFRDLISEFKDLGLKMLDENFVSQAAKSNKLDSTDSNFNLLLEQGYIDAKGNFNKEIQKAKFWLDKKFVCTGTFQKIKRSDLVRLLTSLGAQVQATVNKQTNYLIVGEKAGSKLQKAEKLGISCLSEADFWQIFAK